MIRKVAENDVYKKFASVNGLNDFESMPNGFRNELAEEEMDFSEEFQPIDIQKVIDDTIEEEREAAEADNIKED